MASARSPFPFLSIKFLIPIPTPPPITTKIVPPVTARAFAVISSSRLTIKGKPADSPERINLFTPKANRTKRVKIIPVEPLLISSAIIKRSAARNKLDMRTIFRRLNRSRKIPT